MRQEEREEVNVATKGHVLYCEDNEDTRILMTMMLERAGFKVTYGASVKECAEYQNYERADDGAMVFVTEQSGLQTQINLARDSGLKYQV